MIESVPLLWHRCRAAELLLRHCAALGADSERPSARDRLEDALGRDLAEHLVFALTSGR